MNHVTHVYRRAAAAALVAGFACALALIASPSRAQVAPNTPPGVDHYLVYPVIQPPTVSIPVILGDQFIPTANYVTSSLLYFLTPVSKNGEPIVNPDLHYTWWKVNSYQFQATCLISNQFSPAQPFNVGASEFLMNPALKNVQSGAPIPVANHYVVYDAASPPANVPVQLIDQFGAFAAIALDARFLAAPAFKIFNGVNEPIVDPVPHMAIYVLQPQSPPPPVPITCLAFDEFGPWPLQLAAPALLAVPSYKTNVVDTKHSTWGQIKSLYR
ncbi:MAG TPA: hypothetical protein VMH61_09190 [Candidatus Acidoferrales bacterium]|nr:hypothetical protein [Candidatus Acidoferrales bacterium]